MAHEIVHPISASYARSLLDRHDEPTVLAMERFADENGFPIVNRHVGATLELLTLSANASSVFELGSGYGYSAYWFAHAVGASGSVHCTDASPENAELAKKYLEPAGLWNHITWHISDAVTALEKTEGSFDIIYNDIDKDGYPDAWLAARDRIRIGGLYICDNVLWSGLAAEEPPQGDGRPPGWTDAIKEHNQLVAEDKAFLSSILPIRDGLMLALRLV